MAQALLVDNDRIHAELLLQAMRARGVATAWTASIRDAVQRLTRGSASIDLVALVVSDRLRPWCEILRDLQEAAWQQGVGEVPSFLVIMRVNFGVEFQLQVERMGARIVIE